MEKLMNKVTKTANFSEFPEFPAVKSLWVSLVPLSNNPAQIKPSIVIVLELIPPYITYASINKQSQPLKPHLLPIKEFFENFQPYDPPEKRGRGRPKKETELTKLSEELARYFETQG